MNAHPSHTLAPQVILAVTAEERAAACAKLLPYQQGDFEGIFRGLLRAKASWAAKAAATLAASTSSSSSSFSSAAVLPAPAGNGDATTTAANGAACKKHRQLLIPVTIRLLDPPLHEVRGVGAVF